MNGYSNFSLASYMFAYYAARVTDEELRQGWRPICGTFR